jgi:hypothetical protein
MKVTKKRAILFLAALACVLATASAAQAVIQAQRGISGIALGMSPASVRASLGTPARIRRGSNDFGPYTLYIYAGGITVEFQGNADVTSVEITGGTDRTATGVGVGSTEIAVKRGVAGVSCQTFAGVRTCQVGRSLPGHRVTVFFLKRGRVNRVTVAFVSD